MFHPDRLYQQFVDEHNRDSGLGSANYTGSGPETGGELAGRSLDSRLRTTAKFILILILNLFLANARLELILTEELP